MPTLQDIQNLKLSGGQVIKDIWYEQLVNVLTEMYNDTKPLRNGYVVEDLIPEADLQLNLGTELKRYKEIHGGWGYFTYGIVGASPTHIYGDLIVHGRIIQAYK